MNETGEAFKENVLVSLRQLNMSENKELQKRDVTTETKVLVEFFDRDIIN
jgi:hypothetical protein